MTLFLDMKKVMVIFGTHSRDKDAIVSLMILCEAGAYYKSRGLTLYNQLELIYEKYGYFKEELNAVTLKGIEGMEQIQSIMERFRSEPPKVIGGYEVLAVRDYKLETITDMISGEVKPTGLPISDVLYYELDNNAWCAIRPSGTEPKIKFYYGVRGESMEDATEKIKNLKGDKIFEL